MSKTTNNSVNTSFQLKGSLFTLTVLYLFSTNLPVFTEELAKLVKQTPKFFQRMPVVLDLHKLQPPSAVIDFINLIQCLREHGLILIGIRGGNTQHQDAAISAGLAIMPNTKAEPNEPEKKTAKLTTKTTAAAPAGNATKIVNQPVRSGQQIYARGGDLIVMAPVSPGAELIADGNIHVYGALRGRALAGVNGNPNARIFCQTLEAELVSIAGHYWISEDLHNSPVKENVHIYLENDRLHAGKF